jgi:HK97 family phage prohead protease
MNYLDSPIEFESKTFGDSGSFEGYAAIFGNVDLGGDIIERDAFKEFSRNADGKTIILNQHNQRDPIGIAEVVQDSKGLAFKGQLVLEAPSARTAYALMKAKALGGMSMGYDVLAGGAETMKSGVRTLKALKLWEISPVTFGMNPLAGISSVKSMNDILKGGNLPSLREFEDFLCEAGFSRTQAKAVAGNGLRKLDRCEADGITSDMLQALKSFSLQ